MLDSIQELIGQFSFGDYVLRSSLPLVFAALLSISLRHRSAALRHRIWLLGLIASLAIPIATWCLPKVTIPLLSNPVAFWAASDTVIPINEESIARLIDANRLSRAGNNNQDPTIGNAGSPVPSDSMADAEDAARTDTIFPATVLHVEHAIVICWLVGLAIGAMVFLMGVFRHKALVSRLSKIDDEQWQAAVATAARQMGLSRCPRTVVSTEQCVPSTTGILNPVLVVPDDWKTWSDEQRDCILLHELAHIRRRDVASQCLARIVILVHWFNPLVWLAARKMRLERELASDDCVLQTGLVPSRYAEQLLMTLRQYRPFPAALAVAMANSARLDDRVVAILDPRKRRDPVGRRLSVFTACSVAVICTIAGGTTLFTDGIAQANEQTGGQAGDSSPQPTVPVWRETHTVRYEKTLPMSAIFSPDGKRLLTSDATGELMDLNITGDNPTYNWKTNVGGTHPAMVYSFDGAKVYATTVDGVRILDAATGNEQNRIVEQNSQPIAIDVFPVKPLDNRGSWTQIVFGNARGYFVKTWLTGSPDKAGTISTSTASDDKQPSDPFAVPLAVDPGGRSAIMTGPVDGTGQFTGTAGNNVLWAYVCGDYEEGSPGNRIMQGHTEIVVSAAWSKDGKVAVTGDASGRVIEWDATTMKESHRRELGGRVGAVAISSDGRRVAAYVLGKQGRVLVWNTDERAIEPTVIHTEFENFTAATAFASLKFSPEGDRIAGCAGDLARLNKQDDRERDPNGEKELKGRVRIWKLAASPHAQPVPKLTFSRKTNRRSSFVIPNNNSLIRTTSRTDKPGAFDFMRIADGQLQSRIVLGDSPVGHLIISADREWLAHQQQSALAADAGEEFDVTVRSATIHPLRATIRDCQQLLALSKAGETVAVVQDDTVSLRNGSDARLVKRAPFNHRRIDAAEFSPDGEWLAISDRHSLILWRWQEDKHERIDLGREVSSLAFSPDGRWIAEGPAADRSIQIRSLETKQVVHTLSTGSPLSVPDLAFAQGGRLLIASDKSQVKDAAVNRIPGPRIFMWDTADGSLAHEIPTSGPVTAFKVTPNELNLIAQIESPQGALLAGWRLDGGKLAQQESAAPAADTN